MNASQQRINSINSAKREAIRRVVDKIKDAGFRVFLSASETYGIFTNEDGSRIVYFQLDDLSHEVTYSGQYTTNRPDLSGTGWRMEVGKDSTAFAEMLDSTPPKWAVGNLRWRHRTLEEHLERYGKSSGYHKT